jgi:hypothetical protein
MFEVLRRGGMPPERPSSSPKSVVTLARDRDRTRDGRYGLMEAGLGDFLFWWSLGIGLFIAFWAAFPVNHALIARGRGHAVVNAYH